VNDIASELAFRHGLYEIARKSVTQRRFQLEFERFSLQLL
jgi:hypothetical protein